MMAYVASKPLMNIKNNLLLDEIDFSQLRLTANQ